MGATATPLRCTKLLAFREPVVKPDTITVPVLTGSGDWHGLTATPGTWRQLLMLLGPKLAHGGAAPEEPPASASRLPSTPKPGAPAGVGGKEAEILKRMVVRGGRRKPVRKPGGQLL